MNFKEQSLGVWGYVKQHWMTFLVLCIGIFFLFKSVTKTVADVTIAKSDTTRTITQVTQPTVYTQSYTPFLVNSKDTIKETIIVPPEFKPSDDISQLKAQVTELSNRLFKYHTYRDTIYLHDTAGTIVGNLNLEDSITQNLIASRKYNYSLKFPKETITVTNTLTAPKRTQVYAGLETQLATPFVPQGGIGVLIKNKSDNILRISSGGQLVGAVIKPYVGIGYYPLISFRKK